MAFEFGTGTTPTFALQSNYAELFLLSKTIRDKAC